MQLRFCLISLFSKFLWRFSEPFAKNVVKGAHALKAAFKGDLGDRKVAVAQKSHGVIGAVLIQHRFEIDAKGAVEDAGKVLIVIALGLGHIVHGDVVLEVVGDIVDHPMFGVGMITAAQKIGPDTMYEIAFGNVGTKKMMATYAKIKHHKE